MLKNYFSFHTTGILVSAIAITLATSACGVRIRNMSAKVSNALSASSIELVSGGNQTGLAGQQLTNDVIVRVLDSSNLPVANAAVDVAVQLGSGLVDHYQVTTDTLGRGTIKWTVGSILNAPQRLQFSAGSSSLSVDAAVVDAFDLVEHQAVAGWDFIDVSAVPNRSGTIYYVIYTTNPGTAPTTAQVKAATAGGTVLAAGSISAGSAHTKYTATVTTGVTAATNYHVYIAAEDSNAELLATAKVKYVALTTAVRNEFVTYVSAVATAAIGSSSSVGYYIYKPREYYRNPQKKMPLLYFYHGSGERSAVAGTPSASLLRGQGIPKYIYDNNATYDETLPFIVVSVQLWAGALWRDTAGIDLMREFFTRINTLEAARINFDRVYQTGLSMGGNGILMYLSVAGYEDTIASSVVASSFIDNEYNRTPVVPCNIAEVPMWAFNGDQDTFGTPGPPSSSYDNMAYTINELNTTCGGGTANKFTSIAGGTHSGAWNAAYKNTHGASHVGGDGATYTVVYDWMLSFRKFFETSSLNVTGSADRIRIIANTVTTGTLYYAIYSSDQGALTDAQVITASGASLVSPLVRRGTAALVSADLNQSYAVRLASFLSGTTYTVYTVYVDANAVHTSAKTSIAL